jgi:hypothetical protein
VSGATGTVILQDNGGDNLTVTANGPFTFATKLASGAAYAVTVQTQPAGQTCTVASGSGTIASANVTNVAVSCTTNATYSVGGTVSGLTGSVVLQDNGGDNLTVAANGPFTFATKLASGASYNVTVQANPTGQTCTTANGTGTIASANITSVTVTCTANAAGSGSDDFNRANGSLGPNWTDASDGGLTITGQQVAGTAGSSYSGDIRTAETYPADQFSQITLTSTQLTGGQWVGAAIRMQNGGQNQYLGIYFWNNGSPDLMLFKRNASNWTQLGTTYNSGPLSAGTTLQVQATGSTISLLQNGVQRISATDTSVATGAPGIMAYGTGKADNWSGGAASSGGGTTTYSVGGTVSGATGTVILQDNGGDNLTVTANGPFTFGTPLADGASYNVTVRTNPVGQTCTVASGTGTVHAANVTSVVVTCTANAAGSGSDDFNRADGSLGPNWADISDGGLAISGQQVTGTSANGVSGDIRTAETYPADQFSQVTLTSTQLTGNQWIGAAVRAQNGGQNAYVGVYNWNNGSPAVMLFLRSAGNWTQLGTTYNSGPLSAGTTLKLMVTGSTLSLLVNGTERVAVGDTTLAGGAPGIMASGAAQADNWSGGASGFEMHFLNTDSSGVSSYDIISANDSDGPHVLRVLKPTNPAAGVAHNFLYVLPVEPEEGTQFGDAMSYLQSIDAEDQYNLTIVEPAFGVDPWYADTSTNPDWQYETFMTQELVPWVRQNLSTTGTEQNWLIGFSKSGIGGQDLIFRHPGVFQLAASWDFPADISSYDQYGTSSAEQYGTDANFQSNYRLTQAFLDSHKGPFTSANRIWIGGYQAFQTDMTDYDSLLTSEGIAHSTETPWQVMPHRWDSGWVPIALTALEQDSTALGG